MSDHPHYRLESREEGSVELPLRPLPACGRCRWLISLDYDGTLKYDDHEPEAAFFELMQRLRSQGVYWGINTGRSLQKLAAELEKMPYTPDFVCTCERYAYPAADDGRLRPADEHNRSCHLANMELRRSILPAWQAALAPLQHPGWQFAADDPLSIEAIDSPTLDALMPHLIPFANEQVAIQRAGRFMRLSAAEYSKGSALHHVQQCLGVAEDHICMLGDGHNDIDAFRLFPQAFRGAPSTAHDDVIAWLQANGGYISGSAGVCEALLNWAQNSGILLP